MKAGPAFAIVGVALLAIGLLIAALQPRVEPVVDLDAAARAEANARAAAGGGERPRAGDDTATRTTAVAAGSSGVVEPDPDVLTLDLRVEWPDGRPAAGAELWYVPPRTALEAAADGEVFVDDVDLEVALRARGRSTTVDGDGRARLQVCDETPICVRSGDHYACAQASIYYARAPRRLVLHRDVALTVEVVDAHGAPRAGVVMVARGHFTLRSDGFPNGEQVQLPPTDERGIARVPHLQQSVPMPSPEVVDWSFELVAHARVADSPERPVTVDELLRGEPIRCVVPGGGVVEVTVTDDDGNASREWIQMLDLATGERFRASQRDEQVHRFFDVPLGRRWRVVLRRAGDQWHEQELVGPSRFGEVVKVSITLPFRRVQLAVAVVCEDGSVAVGAMATVAGHIAGGPRSGLEWSSASGVVRDGDRTVCSLWLGRGERLLRATLRVQHPSLADLTEVPLAGELAADADLGRVVVPLPRACEELLRVRARFAGEVVTKRARIEVDAGPHGSWATRILESVHEGDYLVLRGLRPPHSLRLSCGFDGAKYVIREGIACGEVVDIELEPVAELVVPVRARRVPSQVLEVIVSTASETFTGSRDGDFLYCHHLPLGPCTLCLRVDGHEILRREVPPLVAGRNVWPSWDEPIDLDRLVRVVHLRVVDPEGGGPEYWGRVLLPCGENVLPPNWREGRNPGWLRLEDTPRDLLVWGHHHVPVRLPQPTQDLVVELQPYTKLVVREAAGSDVEFTVAVTKHGLVDPLLRAVVDSDDDRDDQHGLGSGGEAELAFVPGTELVLTVKRGDAPARELKVVVGTTSPQEVLLR